jgi:hypothetical protein
MNFLIVTFGAYIPLSRKTEFRKDVTLLDVAIYGFGWPGNWK